MNDIFMMSNDKANHDDDIPCYAAYHKQEKEAENALYMEDKKVIIIFPSLMCLFMGIIASTAPKICET
ncbi:hypothetical protein AAHA92_31869 [Salvia divinorum]|uniref:Uncharacterized protein n=1 Tax=Salvia divinorum TaxID=28513 RepID=A0ABD1FIV3_SALDI